MFVLIFGSFVLGGGLGATPLYTSALVNYYKLWKTLWGEKSKDIWNGRSEHLLN